MTVSVKPPEPAVAELGVMEVVVGVNICVIVPVNTKSLAVVLSLS